MSPAPAHGPPSAAGRPPASAGHARATAPLRRARKGGVDGVGARRVRGKGGGAHQIALGHADGPHARDGEPVLGDGAGLVEAEDVDGRCVLNRVEARHQDAAPGEAERRDRLDDGEDGGQRDGDGAHEERRHEREHRDEIGPAEKRVRGHEDGRGDADVHHVLDDVEEQPLLARRRAGVLDERDRPAEVRAPSRVDDKAAQRPLDDDATREGDVGRPDAAGQRLAREGRSVHRCGTRDHVRVGGDQVAEPQLDHVARNEVAGGDLGPRPVAQGEGPHLEALLQKLDRAPGVAGLHLAHDGVQGEQGEDDDRLGRVPHGERERHGELEQPRHGPPVALEERERGRRALLLDGVGADRAQARARLRAAQTLVGRFEQVEGLARRDPLELGSCNLSHGTPSSASLLACHNLFGYTPARRTCKRKGV